MCGIAGFLTAPGAATAGLETAASGMAWAIRHRGPDDAGAWADGAAGIALGHRRLAILDLSPAGHQPMASTPGRFVLAFNGEIYNHLQLRQQLQAEGAAPEWRGHSDTETLLACFEQWGLEATLVRCVGMFAIALWDARSGTLSLARDRLGEKPLYYGWTGDGASQAFVFGSELKALRAYPGFANPVCREALAAYLRFLYVPAPRSIYQGIFKLEPGCLLSMQGGTPGNAPARAPAAPASHGGLQLRRWWSLASTVDSASRSALSDDVEAVDLLEARLSDAVALQSLADVPLGAFLSGGVDSSTIVALMQKQSAGRVKTFTVGFEDAGYDESDHAGAIAAHLGTEHSALFVSSADARSVIPGLPQMYDEPFADSSQVPTHLVCRAAREHVTVALSGDGGDELFGGYDRYFWGPRAWRRVAALPPAVRRALGRAICALPTPGWDVLGGVLNSLRPGAGGLARVGEKAHKFGSRLRYASTIDEFYLSLVSEWQDPALVVRRDDHQRGDAGTPALSVVPDAVRDDASARMMYRDSVGYLPDDILCKVDRAAMAIGLETRVPMLDHRVVELAWRLPSNMKIREGQGKWALRQVLYRHVPRALIDRPKQGFAIPLGAWLRGPLRPWAEALLAQPRLQEAGYFHPGPIRRMWQEHLEGRRDHTAGLWAILMFQAWLEHQAGIG